MNFKVKHFFDVATFTLTYVVYDPTTKDAIIIDPVLNYDPASGVVSFESIELIHDFVRDQSLTVHLILETHVHADHMTGAHELVQNYFKSSKVAISERITEIQKTFKTVFNYSELLKTDGSQFDRLLKDFEKVEVGSLSFEVLPAPGHTPACVCYKFGDAVFTGDVLFMPDYGTGRCDFPNGDARALFHSVFNCLYKLPDSTRVFVGHDYLPGGRDLAFETTIGESKARNVQLNAETLEDDFLAFRRKRDSTLSAPKLLYPSIQVNIQAGKLPPPEANGRSYLKLPLTIRRV